MKCTNRNNYINRRKMNARYRRRKRIRNMLIFFAVILAAAGAGFGYSYYDEATRVKVDEYEVATYQGNVTEIALFADDLCVVSSDVSYDKFQTQDEFHAVSLMNLNENEVLLAENVHERLFPASTTKLLTIYTALKHGNLTDIVTVSENAYNVPWDSSRAWLSVGDQLTLEDLLYALMLPSGNDSAVAIAEHISGDVESYMELMNQEAYMMGATNTHFVTPHGYQDEDHYTTAYDLYLILNQCLKNEKFVEVVSSAKYSTVITDAAGNQREVTWKQSNMFINGSHPIPDGVSIIGGKTGTTNEAGACLVLCSMNDEDQPYISIIMGADSKPILYDNMSSLLTTIND